MKIIHPHSFLSKFDKLRNKICAKHQSYTRYQTYNICEMYIFYNAKYKLTDRIFYYFVMWDERYTIRWSPTFTWIMETVYIDCLCTASALYTNSLHNLSIDRRWPCYNEHKGESCKAIVVHLLKEKFSKIFFLLIFFVLLVKNMTLVSLRFSLINIVISLLFIWYILLFLIIFKDFR